MEEALAWLYQTRLFGIKLGLDNAIRLLAGLTPPSPPPRVIHVAGTNGKGSVCAFLDSLARAGGHRSGLFTSPHLVRYNERIRMCGREIAPRDLQGILANLRQRVGGWDSHPTFFEISLAAAMTHFYAEEADVIILETGMGGRLDATNAVSPVSVSVLTPVSLDHQSWLGESLQEIAGEKAGIMKPGVPVFSAPQEPEVLDVLHRIARANGCAFHLVDTPVTTSLSLAGESQRHNAALAIAVIAAAGIELDAKSREEALRSTRWPARFQRLTEHNPEIILDGAHNPSAARSLCRTWEEVFGPERKATLLFGAVQGKDVGGILTELTPLAARLLLTPIQSTRTLTVSELHSCFPQHAYTPCRNLDAALDCARGFPDPILVAGSLFLAGEALQILARSSPASPENHGM